MGVHLLVGCVSNPANEAGDLTVVAARAPSAVVAFRDGERGWVVASGADSPLTFRANSGEYTVAIGCSDPSGGLAGRADVYEMTLADLAVLTYDQDCDTSSAVALSGTVTGFDVREIRAYEVKWGNRSTGVINLEKYALTTYVGERDLVATRGYSAVDRILVIRGFSITSDTVQPVDFDSPATLHLVYQPVEVTANGGYLRNYFFSAGGTAVELGAYTNFVLAVPESAMGAGDLQRVSVLGRGGNGYGQIFTTEHVSRAPATTIELVGPIADHPIVTGALRNGVVDVHATWVPQRDAVAYQLYVGNWSIHVSPAVLEAGRISVPNLSAVRGWDAALGLRASMTDWAISVATGAPLDDVLRTLPIHEGEISRSGWTGFVSP